MRGSSADGRMSGFALTLNALFAVIEFGVVAMAAAGFEEVADAAPFGRTGTIALCGVSAVITCAGAVLAWRGVSGPVGALTGILLAASIGLTALLALSLVTAGGAMIILVVPLAHAVFSMATIVWAIRRAVPMVERR
ncbi:hypothetical protein [Actinoplanes sp. NPDC049802]|uniref:hypothetical protein n=1 Tax=Actinoplanes sp. NPDC049802 TaxID=3154742 RepID=UPI0033F7CF2B